MRLSFSRLAQVAALSLSLACHETPSPAILSPTAESIARSYRELVRMTEEPISVTPEFFYACVMINGSGPARTRGVADDVGPHSYNQILVYMNERAATAYRTKALPFPVGSVVVKEKGPFSTADLEGPAKRPGLRPGLGGMIKRPAGYNPDHGDWEYFYVDDSDSLGQGKLESCIQCHDGAAKTDFVFGGLALEGENSMFPK